MFKENYSHLQPELFNTATYMNPRTRAMLEKRWAPLYYKHIFCKIDEKMFVPLYYPDNGCPNKPVNILLSLEFLKHLPNYTDEEILKQYYFNYQALGQHNLGKLYTCEQTRYNFRRKVYEFVLATRFTANLVFQQFDQL